ncbi:hypothetical protein P8452_22967 [Trifolium repens]|nr:hypothetical protein P8452_22967 [Trifolium repens]
MSGTLKTNFSILVGVSSPPRFPPIMLICSSVCAILEVAPYCVADDHKFVIGSSFSFVSSSILSPPSSTSSLCESSCSSISFFLSLDLLTSTEVSCSATSSTSFGLE